MWRHKEKEVWKSCTMTVMVLEVQHANDSLFVVNVYNPSDSSTLIPLLSLSILGSQPCIISGDFNLHHPLWSLNSMDHKSDQTSDILVETLLRHHFVRVTAEMGGKD